MSTNSIASNSSTSTSTNTNPNRKVYTTTSALRVIASPNPTEEFNKHYSIGKVLGKGSFATVYQATHLRTGEQFAVKVIGFNTSSKTKAETEEMKKKKEDSHFRVMTEQLEREITFFSNVPSHPNIIDAKEVYTTIKNDIVAASLTTDQALPTSMAMLQQTYIVLELADGGDLFDVIIKSQGLSELECRCVFRQLLSATHHMHAFGFAHSDLKPENILLKKTSSTPGGSISQQACECKNRDGTPISPPHFTIKVEDFGFTRCSSDSVDQDKAWAQHEKLYCRRTPFVNSTAFSPKPQSEINDDDDNHNTKNNKIAEANKNKDHRRHPLFLGRQETSGSFAFVNPEKILTARGKIESFDSFSADIWSLGVILFMVASACDPFTNSDPSKHGGRSTFDNILVGGFKRSAKVWALPQMLDLLSKIFLVDTSKRLFNSELVAEHPWVFGNPDSATNNANSTPLLVADQWTLQDYVVADEPKVAVPSLPNADEIKKSVAATINSQANASSASAMQVIQALNEQIQNKEIIIEKKSGDAPVVIAAANNNNNNNNNIRLPVPGAIHGTPSQKQQQNTVEVPISTINELLNRHHTTNITVAQNNDRTNNNNNHPFADHDADDISVVSLTRSTIALDADSLLLSDLVNATVGFIENSAAATANNQKK